MTVRLLIGDCRVRLKDLPDASVNCCVTSPPYFGLRDYGTAQWEGGSPNCDHLAGPLASSKSGLRNDGREHRGPYEGEKLVTNGVPYKNQCGKCGATRIDRQMGLEPTPDEFVAGMVEVFREVRRVLRDDGVLFLNIGDSYFNTGVSGPQGKGGLRANRTFTAEGLGSGANVRRAGAYGKRGKAPEGSPAHDCFCQSLCGACREAYQIGRSHSAHSLSAKPSASSSASSLGHTESQSDRLPMSDSALPHDRNSAATPDLALGADREGEPLPDVRASTTPQSSPQSPATCLPVESQDGECRLCACSLLRSALASAHTAECICDSAPLALDDRNLGRGVSGLAYPSFTTESLKPKDLIGIPWMLAFALRADGWYLRQDIIWSKPNPMPESVRDRCTKAHEYLFLLSKGSRYYYDAEAIAEAGVVPAGTRRTIGKAKEGGLTRAESAGRQPSGNEAAGFTIVDGTRNKRSVWEVATQPFSEAHFATYPPALIEPCILAGCPKGGIVLDPFGGAGTTGLVADRLQRDAILIELNPEYAEIARKRIADEAGMFAQVAA